MSSERGICELACQCCLKDVVNAHVVVEDCPLKDDNGRYRLVHYCEACYQQHRETLDIQHRNVRPLLNEPCDLCQQTTQSRYCSDLACRICDDCFEQTMTSDRDLASSSGLTKSDFDLPSEIVPKILYLGSRLSSLNDELMLALNIRQVVVCCRYLEAHFYNNNNLSKEVAQRFSSNNENHNTVAIRYLRLPVTDSLDENLLPFLESAIDFVDQGVQQQCATLIHCRGGVSRSASVVIAYIMRKQQLTYNLALAFVKSRRNSVCPNSAFAEQLRLFENFDVSGD
jgi:hypothetical protein